MQTYRLKAGRRGHDDHVTTLALDEEIYAKDDAEAIKRAKMFQVSYFLKVGDFAWLSDASSHQIWSLRLEEAG